MSDRILTVPNLLSFARLLGVPLFLWLLLRRLDGWALIVLVLSAITDYLDGKIARAFGLESRPLYRRDPGRAGRPRGHPVVVRLAPRGT